jgi:hypothetical protein
VNADIESDLQSNDGPPQVEQQQEAQPVQQRQPAQSYNRHMGVNDEFEAGPAKMAGPNDDLKGQCASDGGSQIGSESNGIRCAIPDGVGGQKEFFYTKHGVKPVEDDYNSAQMANCLNGHCNQNKQSRIETTLKNLGRYMGQEDKRMIPNLPNSKHKHQHHHHPPATTTTQSPHPLPPTTPTPIAPLQAMTYKKASTTAPKPLPQPNQLVMNTPTKISLHLIQVQADSLA